MNDTSTPRVILVRGSNSRPVRDLVGELHRRHKDRTITFREVTGDELTRDPAILREEAELLILVFHGTLHPDRTWAIAARGWDEFLTLDEWLGNETFGARDVISLACSADDESNDVAVSFERHLRPGGRAIYAKGVAYYRTTCPRILNALDEGSEGAVIHELIDRVWANRAQRSDGTTRGTWPYLVMSSA